MANGFVCARCGWQETYHYPVHFEDWEVEEAKRVKDGFFLSLLGDKGTPHCGGGYTLSEEEKKHNGEQEEKREWLGLAVASRVD